uniref:Peptidase S1 domain-containing protein n=1 Tax=Trichuris muris TaxID=70415 RepID=A0A5S6R5M9_TRIMR
MPPPTTVIYVFRTENQDLRTILVKVGAGALCWAAGNLEMLSWLLTACHAVAAFGRPTDDVYIFEYFDVNSMADVSDIVMRHPDDFKTPLSTLLNMNEELMHVYVAFAGLLIGKNISVQSYPAWITRHLRDFFGLLHVPAREAMPEVPFQTADTLHFEFERSLTLRRVVFFTLAFGAELESADKNVYRHAMELLRFAKMTGLRLIFDFLMCDTPFPILFLDRWAPDRHHLLEALEIYLRYPEDERPYLRILYDEMEMRPLGGSKLERLTYAALLIGQSYFPALANYKMRISANREIIRRDVEYWLQRRSIGPFVPESYFPLIPQILEMTREAQDAEARRFRAVDRYPEQLASSAGDGEREENQAAVSANVRV